MEAWKSAKELAIFIYSLTRKYPTKEQFALTSQTTRAVVSIAANIAEGSSRSSKKDFSRFLEISIGSGFELETLMEISFGLLYITREEKTVVDLMIGKTLKLTFGLKRKLNE